MDIMSFYKGEEFEAYKYFGAHITEKGTVELRSDINIEDYSMENMAKKFADLLNEL